MIFHEADDPSEISYLKFVINLGKMSQNLSSAAVVIGTLWVKTRMCLYMYVISV